MGMVSAGIRNPSELARRMKIHRQTAHKWFDGQSDNLTPEMLFKLADILHVNPRWLAFGQPESPVAPRQIDTEAEELIQIRDALPPDARDDWLKHGRTLVRHTAPKSTTNPFPAKIK